MDEYVLSSPDPLVGSRRTLPPRTTRSVARKSNYNVGPVQLPLNPTIRRTKSSAQLDSPDRQGQMMQLQNFVFDTPQGGQRSFSASPSKSSIKTENHLSPWRIRVTVEAERDENSQDGNGENDTDTWNQNESSPTRGRGRTRTRTTTSTVPVKGLGIFDLEKSRGRPQTRTMTVPVRGLESSPPVMQEKRGRGRPRKSATPAKPRARNGTSVRARNGTPAANGRRKAVGEITATGGGEEAEDLFNDTPKKARGRPKKTKTPAIAPGRRREGSILDMERDEESAPAKATPAKKVRGRKKSLAIEEEADSILRDIVGEEELSEITIPSVVIHSGYSKLVSPVKKGRGGRMKAKVGGDIWTNFDPEPEERISLQSPAITASSAPVWNMEPEERISLQTPAVPATSKSTGATPAPKRGRAKKKTKSPVTIAVDPDMAEKDELERDSQHETTDDALANVEVNRSSSRSTQSSVNSLAMIQASVYDTLPAVSEEDLGEQMDAPWEKFSPAKKTSVKSKQHLSVSNSEAGPSGLSVKNINTSLITPEETPSPPSARPSEGHGEIESATQPQSPQASSITYSPPHQRLSTGPFPQKSDEMSFLSNIRSSPPQRILDYSFPPPIQQTPTIMLSSSSLPPPLLQADRKHEGLQALEEKSNLSPNSKQKTPRLARIVRAGIALQDALTTFASRSSHLGSPFTSPAKTNELDPSLAVEALFSGFGSGTRRELMAGLKFGEELARRQMEAAEKKEMEARSLMVPPQGDDVFGSVDQSSSVGYPRLPAPEDQGSYALRLPGQTQVDYPRLQNQEDISSTPPDFNEGDKEDGFDDGMSWRIDTPVEELPTGATVEAVARPAMSARPSTLRLALLNAASRNLQQVQDKPREEPCAMEESAVIGCDASENEDRITLPTNRRRVSQQAQFAGPTQEQEVRWQREREAISRQIQMTNKSQVIVINSDDEVDENDHSKSSIDPEEKYEAYRVKVLQDQERQLQDDCQHSSTLEEEMKESVNLNKIFSSDNVKPPRGKIPSPWRGNRDVVYSDEVVEYWNGSSLPAQGEPSSPPAEGVDYEDKEGDETMSPIHAGDLSTLLGLKSSPIKFSSESNPSQPKTLRQRLIEKFTTARQDEQTVVFKQPSVEAREPLKTKNNKMQISGNLVLPRPFETYDPYEDETTDRDNTHVPGLFGASFQDPKLINGRPAPKRRVRSGHQDPSTNFTTDVSSPIKPSNVATTENFARLTLCTPLVPSDEPTGSSFAKDESPLLHKGVAASAKPQHTQTQPETPKNPLANTTTTWEKRHWTHLDNLWVQVKLLPPTYSTKNLTIRYPAIEKTITLSDAEMGVADQFVADMLAANPGREGEVGEEFTDLRLLRKRVGNLRYGEIVRRARGEVYDEKGQWVGKGRAGLSVKK